MTSQSQLYQDLRQAESTESRRELALALMDRSNSRQYIDDCLRILKSPAVLATLDDRQRPILRRKCLSYYDDSKRDKAGMLREGITRLLVHIEHPEDADLYKLGVETYYFQPIDDVAQNLRAVALAGLAPIDLSLACIYATRFLGEPFTSVFNCEPAMTAIDVLAGANQRLPIYQFLLHSGETMAQTGRGELTGKALESLGDDFPLDQYGKLIGRYQAIDQATATMGIINWLVEQRAEALYDQLEAVIMDTRDVDLRRYGLVMLAVSRDEELTERLLGMARIAKIDDVPLFVEAIEVCQHSQRDEILASLRKRITK